MKIKGTNLHFYYHRKNMTKQGYQHKDLFWNSWQVTQYSSNIFNIKYDLPRPVL